jgi:threonine aldolase
MPDQAEIDRIRARCTRFLSYHRPDQTNPKEVLAALAAATSADVRADMYGQGEVIEAFEQEIAVLLGKEAAVFMPSGTMAQAIALRIWCDRRGLRSVAFHPTCHLERDEEKGYQMLHGLHGVLAGSPHLLMTLGDVQKIRERLGALLLELPQRRIGGQLPPWEDLLAIVEWARGKAIALHLDGARLWECKPFYRRDYAEIAGLFDSVYVSFYKSLGGIAGAILAGPADFIAEARVWQRRQGGNLVSLYPYVLSARAAVAERLGKMDAYCDKAIEIARGLGRLPEIEIVPNPPHTNMMHVCIRGDRLQIEAAALELARTKGLWLFGRLSPTHVPSVSFAEVVVADAALEWTADEVEATFRELLAQAAPPMASTTRDRSGR